MVVVPSLVVVVGWWWFVSPSFFSLSPFAHALSSLRSVGHAEWCVGLSAGVAYATLLSVGGHLLSAQASRLAVHQLLFVFRHTLSPIVRLKLKRAFAAVAATIVFREAVMLAYSSFTSQFTALLSQV